MKKLLLLSALFTVLLFPLAAPAKDKKKDRDEDYYKKQYKETRDDVKELQEHYGRVRDQLKNGQGGRSAWEQLRAIGVEVDRVSVQFERSSTDPRYLRDRVRQLESALTRLSQQAQDSGRRGGYYDSRRYY